MIAQAAQTISFPALPAKSVGDPAFALPATSTSGLAITYQSDNLAVATVSGGLLTFVGPGTANITATQGGNINYLAAAAVSQLLTVNPATAGGGSDVPAMPVWALALLTALLFAVAVPLLNKKRQAG